MTELQLIEYGDSFVQSLRQILSSRFLGEGVNLEFDPATSDGQRRVLRLVVQDCVEAKVRLIPDAFGSVPEQLEISVQHHQHALTSVKPEDRRGKEVYTLKRLVRDSRIFWTQEPDISKGIDELPQYIFDLMEQYQLLSSW